MRPITAWLVTIGVGLVYTVLYLYAIGDITTRSGLGVHMDVMPDAADKLWQRRFGWRFEAIALVLLPGLRWLLSPVNLAIASLLGGLVGVNAVLGVMAYRSRQCAIGGTTATLATVPALLSGAACCAPLTLLVLGIPATASVLGLFSVVELFQWLVPIAAAMLIASAIWLRHKIA